MIFARPGRTSTGRLRLPGGPATAAFPCLAKTLCRSNIELRVLNGGGVDSEPPTIYQEMYTGALYLDKPAEVERFDAAFEAIWDTALDERSSRTLISKTAEDMRHG